jgi:PAS domain S-box-containing protein
MATPPAPEPLATDPALFAAVADAVSDALVVADADGRLILWAGGAEALFGWRADEALGMPLSRLVPERLRDAHLAAFGAVAGGAPGRLFGVRGIELEAQRADGTVFPCELTLGRGRTGDGEFFVGVVRDVTDRHAAAAELARSAAEHEQFAAVASHDLLTPLQVVDGMLKLLRRRHGAALPDDAREMVGAAAAATGRMRELIDALLRYAQVGRGDVVRERVDLAALVAELPPAGRDGVVVEAAAHLPCVEGDPVLLRQALGNLVGNAARVARSRVLVEADEGPDAWTVRVGDDGPGVPDALRATLFDAYVRGEGETAGAAGLGLTIVRRVAERHGGTVQVGTSPLGGAELRLTLPRAADQR